VFDAASPALFFTRTRVLTSKERQSIFQDWGSDAGPVVRGLDVNGLKKQLWHKVLPFQFDSMRGWFLLGHVLLESIK